MTRPTVGDERTNWRRAAAGACLALIVLLAVFALAVVASAVGV